ncbi:MAG: tyrosine recombinase XerC [Aristaeellaceae bacterium]
MPKKRANGDGCIRQRADGRWEGRYTLGRDPGTGRQVQKSVYGKTKAEVAQKMRAITHEIDQGIYTDPTKITVGAWLDTWHADYLGSVKASTASQYEYQIRVRIKPALGAVKLSELTAPMIQRMYNNAVKSGLSPKSVRNLHGVMHKALDQAVELQYIRVNPCEACKLPRVEKHEIRPIEGEKISAFLQAIRGTPNEELLFVDVFSGLRQAAVPRT